MKHVPALISLAAAIAFIWSVVYVLGILVGAHAIDLVAFVTFSDIANVAITATAAELFLILGLFIIFATVAPTAIREIINTVSGSAPLHPSIFASSVSTSSRFKPSRTEWFTIIFFILVSLALYWFMLKWGIEKLSFYIEVAELVASAIIFAILLYFMVGRFLQKGIALLVAIFVMTNMCAGIVGVLDGKKRSECVNTNTKSETNHTSIVIITLDRGLGVLDPNTKIISLVPWKEIKRVTNIDPSTEFRSQCFYGLSIDEKRV